MEPASQPSTPYNAAPATPPVSHPPEPLRSESPRSSGDTASIGKSVVIRGELTGSEDLFLDGEIEGSISLRGQTLTVGPNGRIRADIEARNVVLHGRVDGNIKAADRVDLRKSATLSGDIATARISIEDGAYFKGTIDIQKPEPAHKPEFKAQTAPAPAATTSDAQSITTQGTLLDPKKV